MRRRAVPTRPGRVVPLALLLLVSALAAPLARAEDAPSTVTLDPAVATTPGLDPTDVAEGDAGRAAGPRVTPLVAPIPFKNSQLGWGLALMVGAIHRFDPDTTLKPSTGVVGGFYTENGSWGLIAMEMARLRGDTWRVRGLVSHVDVRYDFYGIGQEAGNAGVSVPIGQTMDFGVGSVVRRITPGIYAGGAILWMRTSVSLRDPPTGLEPSSDDLARTDLFAPGIQAEYDTRDDDYWPTHGSVAKLKTWFFSDALGGSRSFQRYLAGWSWYTSLRPQVVLATNLTAAAAAGDAPFYALPTIGGGLYALRGYTQGRYRDKVMTTAQAELRVHAAGRLGATMFGGFGQVAPSAGDLTSAEALPAGGLGLRYRLTREFPMHMRFDYAWGKNGNLFYFSVAEAF
ncbi:MAG: BamA/TamA family outer membrane protein [Candidatus Eisenbacteria bacterium]